MRLKFKFLLIFIFLFSCKKESIPDPETVLLSSPKNGDSCTTALNINTQESPVNFKPLSELNCLASKNPLLEIISAL